MSRFVVVYYQSGGCDYTIACGTKVEHLSKDVTTMEEAEKCIDIDDIDKCTILEVVATNKIDLKAIRQKIKEKAEAKKAKKAKKARLEQYQKLREEFGE